MNAQIKIIPHKDQRYETCGDWFYDAHANLQIRVSQLPDGRYEQLVAIHEYIEATLCEAENITQEDVDAFDMEYEKQRKHGDESEPGDDLRAPYYKQHQIATGVERILAQALGVDWQKYEKAINNLFA